MSEDKINIGVYDYVDAVDVLCSLAEQITKDPAVDEKTKEKLWNAIYTVCSESTLLGNSTYTASPHTKALRDKLPSVCPKHPRAQIGHTWISSAVYRNNPIDGFSTCIESMPDTNNRWFCGMCGTELCSPDEYEERQKYEEENGL